MKNIFLNNGEVVNMNQIEEAILEMKVVLPNEYKNFLSHIDSGNLIQDFFELRKFDIDETNANLYVIVEEFFTFDRLKEVWQFTKEDLQDDLLFPIADVRGGMLICCKQAKAINAEIYFYDYNFGVLKLTNSLAAFLENLILEEEVDYRKYGFSFKSKPI